MRVLAIDTALEACSVAVLDTERADLRAHESLLMQRGHAEALMPLVARVLDRVQLDFSALDRVAVTTGPGSFTGLRVGIAAARGIALASGKPAIGLTTLAAFAAPFIAADDTLPVVVAIDARHDHVYLQVFGPGGRTLVAPRIAPLREALRVSSTGAPRITGTAAAKLATLWPAGERPPTEGRAARRTRHQLGRAPRRRSGRHRHTSQTFVSSSARRPPAGCCAIGPSMIGFISNLFGRAEPKITEASTRDASAIAALHGRLISPRLERAGGRRFAS